MNIASLLKSDKENLLNGASERSAAWPAGNPKTTKLLLAGHPSPAVSVRSDSNDPELSRRTHKLLWVDMITNALIVIVIASVSYFVISAQNIEANLDAPVISASERFRSR
jgi:hypothetical protein